MKKAIVILAVIVLIVCVLLFLLVEPAEEPTEEPTEESVEGPMLESTSTSPIPTSTVEPIFSPSPIPTFTPLLIIEPTSTPLSIELTLIIEPTPESDCDPAYPDVCIPSPPPDLNCGDVPYTNFRVLSPDPHRFDGNKDGVGCEN